MTAKEKPNVGNIFPSILSCSIENTESIDAPQPTITINLLLIADIVDDYFSTSLLKSFFFLRQKHQHIKHYYKTFKSDTLCYIILNNNKNCF